MPHQAHWRYIEALSTYGRMFMEKDDRPAVDRIENIRPPVAIQQKNPVRTGRSTVGTTTEIYDDLRLLFAKTGKTFCPQCGKEVRSYSPSDTAEDLIEGYAGEQALILFPPPKSLQQISASRIQSYAKKGYIRLKVAEKVVVLSEGEVPNLGRLDQCHVVVDRLVIKEEVRKRLVDSLETAFREGCGAPAVEIVDKGLLRYGQGFRCHSCDQSYEKPQPLLFSFNHPLGACPECKGFGQILKYSGHPG